MNALRRPFVALLACALLLGCAGLPGTDHATTTTATQQVRLALQNDADETYAVRLTVVAGEVSGYAVTDANGTTREYGAPLPSNATRGATDVRPLGRDPVSREYALAPGSGLGTTIEGRPRNATVAYVVRRPEAADPLRSWGLARCPDADVAALSIRVAPDGHVAVETRCADATTTAVAT